MDLINIYYSPQGAMRASRHQRHPPATRVNLNLKLRSSRAPQAIPTMAEVLPASAVGALPVGKPLHELLHEESSLGSEQDAAVAHALFGDSSDEESDHQSRGNVQHSLESGRSGAGARTLTAPGAQQITARPAAPLAPLRAAVKPACQEQKLSDAMEEPSTSGKGTTSTITPSYGTPSLAIRGDQVR